MNAGMIFFSCLGLFVAGFCLYKMGKYRAENENIRGKIKRQRQKLAVASLPAASWDDLVEWMRNGGKSLSTVS